MTATAPPTDDGYTVSITLIHGPDDDRRLGHFDVTVYGPNGPTVNFVASSTVDLDLLLVSRGYVRVGDFSPANDSGFTVAPLIKQEVPS